MKGAVNQTIMLYANPLCRRSQIEILIAETVLLVALFNRQKKEGGRRRRLEEDDDEKKRARRSGTNCRAGV